jgi:hypothetical protein
MLHANSVKLISSHQFLVVLLLYGLHDLWSLKIDSEIQVSKVDSHIVVQHLIVLILGSPLILKAFIDYVLDLVTSLILLLLSKPRLQVMIHKDKCSVFQLISNHDGALLA